jgi:transcriptional regulator with XRE-family HTH domain
LKFTEKVLTLIKERGITKNKLLTDLKIGKNSFVDWETNGNLPNGGTIVKIAEYFGVTTDYLLKGNASQKPNEKREENNMSNQPSQRLNYINAEILKHIRDNGGAIKIELLESKMNHISAELSSRLNNLQISGFIYREIESVGIDHNTPNPPHDNRIFEETGNIIILVSGEIAMSDFYADELARSAPIAALREEMQRGFESLNANTNELESILRIVEQKVS